MHDNIIDVSNQNKNTLAKKDEGSMGINFVNQNQIYQGYYAIADIPNKRDVN